MMRSRAPCLGRDVRAAVRARGRACLTLAVALAACDISPQEENALGDQYAATTRQNVREIRDPAIVAPVAQIAGRIVAVADHADRDWHFYVVDDSLVNAFALPGGHVFVFRGLLERVESSSELAGVLGHEVAHVTLRHAAQQMKSRQKTNVVVTVFCWVTNVCGSAVAQVAIGVGGQALFSKYSRDDEREADSAAVEYLARAGIDPRGVPQLFRRLLRERAADPSAIDAWFSSHPLEEDRITRTEAFIVRLSPPPFDSFEANDEGFASFRGRVRRSR